MLVIVGVISDDEGSTVSSKELEQLLAVMLLQNLIDTSPKFVLGIFAIIVSESIISGGKFEFFHIEPLSPDI